MKIGASGEIARDLERLLGGGSIAGRDDGELLERYARRGDAEAFEALVLRHGPRVRALCRRLVGDEHAAEDASQAVWLVLARRARAVRLDRGGSLGPWLHGVAVRVSRRARAVADRRRDREGGGRALDAEPSSPGPDPAERERWAILHEEVDRLPTAERAALVLCYWEGLTHREAADRLGGPSGTVNVRVKRARERLRKRLVRRGVAGAAGLALLDPIGGTATAAATASSIAARRLAAGVIRTMMFSKLAKTLALAMVAFGLSAGGVLVLARQDAPAKPGDDARADKAPTERDELWETLREAAEAAEAIEDPTERARRLSGIGNAQAQALDGTSARETYRLAVGAVEAALGPDPDRALQVLQSREDEIEVAQLPGRLTPEAKRVASLATLLDSLATSQARSGFYDDAMATVEAMPEVPFPFVQDFGPVGPQRSRINTLFTIVTIRARRGDFEGARSMLKALEVKPEVRFAKLGEIAQLQAKAGQVAEAKTWIGEFSDPMERSILLSDVAEGIRLRIEEARPQKLEE